MPHDLLRGEVKFRDPLDFMVYLHLFSYSYGFNRSTASMSQAQLERFTGAAKNTIKRSLERLAEDGWIKMLEDFEHARMSRKWRVFLPEDRHGPRPGRRGSNSDTVKSGQNQKQTASLSKSDTVTVSKMDPYKERIHKEKSENSLSLVKQNSEVNKRKPMGESCRNASRITSNRSSRNVNDGAKMGCVFGTPAGLWARRHWRYCVTWLLESGLPGSAEPCHSPMAFLASGGIARVFAVVQEDRAKRERAEARESQAIEQERRRRQEEAREAEEAAEREEAFRREFPTVEAEAQAMVQYGASFPTLDPTGALLRNLAIMAWYRETQMSE